MNSNIKRTDLNSFDGCENLVSNISRPDRYSALFEVIRSSSRIIARGSGLSYCNASASKNSTSIDTSKFNRILFFDPNNGRIEVESGIRLGSLLDFVIGQEYYLPVLPGHPMITIGGCVAFNVHGKSQIHTGNFIESIYMLKVFHPDYGEIECSYKKNSDIFFLTVGGFGLTGFITSIGLQLKKLRGKQINIKRIPVSNLLEAVEVLDSYSKISNNIYSWNNLNLRGSNFGRGIVYSETIVDLANNVKSDYRFLSPKNRSILPFSLYNNITVRLMNLAYGINERLKPRETKINIFDGSFPINKKEIYYKLFGKRGFREYQMIIPKKFWEDAVKNIEKKINSNNVVTTLGSLKLFKGETTYLNFSGEGVCLTINIPLTKYSARLFHDIDLILKKYDGIANISKDSRLTAITIKDMYPEYEKFRIELNKYDDSKKFHSKLRERLDV